MTIDETLLEQMSRDIETELGKKRLPNTSRRALQMDRLMLAFMRQNLETQRRVNVMWSVFRPLSWVMVVFITSFIGIIASGRVELIIK